MTSVPVPRDSHPNVDEDIPGFLAEIGLGDGLIDIHVHALPEKLQARVWAYFDQLTDPVWPIEYRSDEPSRLHHLGAVGVKRHTALAYAHREGVAAWCNEHTLGLAAKHERVIPTFTFHAEDAAEDYVAEALDAGGLVAKVHLQVGRFDPLDPRLTQVWAELARRRTVVVLHAGAVYGAPEAAAWTGPDPVRRLLDRHPNLVLVIAHLGSPDDEVFAAMAAEGAVWLDTSATLVDPPWFAPVPTNIIERLANVKDRVLYGSDYPSIPHRLAAQVRGLSLLEPTPAELRAMLHDTAANLLADVVTA